MVAYGIRLGRVPRGIISLGKGQAISDYEDTRGAEGDNVEADDAADRMRDAANDLDGWLTRGGFPPADWSRSS